MQRRSLITGLAALAGGLAGAFNPRRLFAQESTGSALGAGACQLTTHDVTGPFHVDAYPDASNIIAGQAGVPLTLNFQVINVMTCEPLPGARVIIWHSNNEGIYSGVVNVPLAADGRPTGERLDHTGDNFHRGMQTTDENGRAQFVTAFPGWYFPRETHIHLKVLPPDFGEEATTQLYFTNEICDEVYAREGYKHRGPNPTRVSPGDPSPLFSTEAGDLWLDIRKDGDGYVADKELGVVFYGGMFGPLTDYYKQG